MARMADGLTVSLVKRFASGVHVEASFDISLEQPTVLVLFGPSGSGKTTVLRCVAGLERADTGKIACGGSTWFDSAMAIHLPPQARQIGYLFQDYAVFPHLTVRANVEYGLRKAGRKVRDERVRSMLDQFGLSELAERSPRQLSGGQLQRVALARALAPSPQLLLLDEPLSALDGPLRNRLRGDLRKLLVAAGVPSIVVTHDRTEAIALGDCMGVLVDGRLRQIGPVETVFGRPADLNVAHAVGVETVCPGRIVESGSGLLTIQAGPTQIVAVDSGEAEGPDVFFCIRAEHVGLESGDESHLAGSARNRFHGRVMETQADGPLVRVIIDCGFLLTALITRQAHSEMALAAGDTITAVVKATAIHLLPRTGPTPA